MTKATVTLLLLSAAVCSACQSSRESAPAQAKFVLPDLGLRYTPPVGMEDQTTDAEREARKRAAEYRVKAFNVLLKMSSGQADTDSGWHYVWIVAYPRSGWPSLSDSDVQLKMNSTLAGKSAVGIQTTAAVFAGHKFVVSEFEQHEPPLLKHAKIFTTICREQLVSFVFVSNSAEWVRTMEQSLKTLEFSSN